MKSLQSKKKCISVIHYEQMSAYKKHWINVTYSLASFILLEFNIEFVMKIFTGQRLPIFVCSVVRM